MFLPWCYPPRRSSIHGVCSACLNWDRLSPEKEQQATKNISPPENFSRSNRGSFWPGSKTVTPPFPGHRAYVLFPSDMAIATRSQDPMRRLPTGSWHATRNRERRVLLQCGRLESQRIARSVSVLGSSAGVGSGVGCFFNSMRLGARQRAIRMRGSLASTGDFRAGASWCVALRIGAPGF